MTNFTINISKPSNNTKIFRNTPSTEFLKKTNNISFTMSETGNIQYDNPINIYIQEKGAAHAAVASRDVRVNNFLVPNSKNYDLENINNIISSLSNLNIGIDQDNLPWCSICSIAAIVAPQLNFTLDLNRFINCLPSTPDTSRFPEGIQRLWQAHESKWQTVLDDKSKSENEKQKTVLVKKGIGKAFSLLFGNISIPVSKISNEDRCRDINQFTLENNDSICSANNCIEGYIRLSNIIIPALNDICFSNQGIVNLINSGQPVSIVFDEIYSRKLALVAISNGSFSWEDTLSMSDAEVLNELTILDPTEDWNFGPHSLTITGATGPDSSGNYTFIISNSWKNTPFLTITSPQNGSIFLTVDKNWSKNYWNGITFDVIFTPNNNPPTIDCTYCFKYCDSTGEYSINNGRVFCQNIGFNTIRSARGQPFTVENFCDCVCNSDNPKVKPKPGSGGCICDPVLSGPCEGVSDFDSLRLYNDDCDCVCDPTYAETYCANRNKVFDSELCKCVQDVGAWCTGVIACDGLFYIDGCTEGPKTDWNIGNAAGTVQNYERFKNCSDITCEIQTPPECEDDSSDSSSNSDGEEEYYCVTV